MQIFLLTLPFFSPAEPPGQLALLKSLWGEQKCRVFDGNLDFLDYVLSGEYIHLDIFENFSSSQWTRARRACLHVDRAKTALKTGQGYRVFERYLSFVHHLNEAIKLVFAVYPDNQVSLNNFRLLPFAAVDLVNNLRRAQSDSWIPFDDWFSHRLSPKIEQYQPDIIGFSLTYLSQVLPTFYIAARLKERFPRIKRIIGGGLINCYRERPQSLSLLSALFDRIILGRAGDLDSVIQSTRPCLETGDRLVDVPAPNYTDFDLDGYFSPLPVLPYATALGCYWNRCAFCPDAGKSLHISGHKNLALNLRKTLNKYPEALFHFTDPSVPAANMEIISNLFLGRKASYYSFVRFEACFEDEAFIKKLASSGCRMLQFGLESASQRLLNLTRKGVNLDRAERILHMSAQQNILNYVYLLFGLPSETEHDRQKTLDFVVRNRQTIHFINHAIMNLPIGSPMEKEPARFFIDQTYNLGKCQDRAKESGLYKGFTSQGENIRLKARYFLERVFSSHPVVAQILKNDPPFFRAAHAHLWGRSE